VVAGAAEPARLHTDDVSSGRTTWPVEVRTPWRRPAPTPKP
jgi:hypothetical protein